MHRVSMTTSKETAGGPCEYKMESITRADTAEEYTDPNL